MFLFRSLALSRLARLAVLTGTPIVPCYCFGQTRLVRTVTDPFGLMMWLSRLLRVSLVVPLGRRCFPIPARTPCTIALGQPIPVTPLAAGDEGFAAEVLCWHYHKSSRSLE